MTDFSYKITLSYHGGRYKGWQVQPRPIPTVQNELNKALGKISKSQNVKSVASGRTDAGVHALGQVCSVFLPLQLSPEALTKALNSNLPDDIRVLTAQVAPKGFRPINDCEWKEYIYLFTCGERLFPFMKDCVGHCGYQLDIEPMKKACAAFVGEHDFCNFFTVGTPVSTTVRTIYECELTEFDNGPFFTPLTGNVYSFRVRGSGFLKQMVRLMVSAIWSVGRGKVSIQNLEVALRQKCDHKLAPVAPPEGLYLNKVHYLPS